MGTNWEHFCEAVVVLAGPGSVKQRLTDAYARHLANVEADELPRDVRTSFAAFVEALKTSPRAGGLSSAAASILKMSEAEAGRHAGEVVRMFAGLKEQPHLQAAARATPLFRAVAGSD